MAAGRRRTIGGGAQGSDDGLAGRWHCERGHTLSLRDGTGAQWGYRARPAGADGPDQGRTRVPCAGACERAARAAEEVMCLRHVIEGEVLDQPPGGPATLIR